MKPFFPACNERVKNGHCVRTNKHAKRKLPCLDSVPVHKITQYGTVHVAMHAPFSRKLLSRRALHFSFSMSGKATPDGMVIAIFACFCTMPPRCTRPICTAQYTFHGLKRERKKRVWITYARTTVRAPGANTAEEEGEKNEKNVQQICVCAFLAHFFYCALHCMYI